MFELRTVQRGYVPRNNAARHHYRSAGQPVRMVPYTQKTGRRMEICNAVCEGYCCVLHTDPRLTLPQSALLLNGDVALLTVSVNPNAAAGAQQACYISTVISVASTVAGLLLTRQAQTKQKVSTCKLTSVSKLT